MQTHSTISACQYDVIVVGAGISGLTAAKKCKDLGLRVAVFEQENSPGGLIRCDRVEGCLYHLVGGHVFNTKDKDVRSFFWEEICRKEDFVLANRSAEIQLDERLVGYPIENNIAHLGKDTAEKIIEELLDLSCKSCQAPVSFGDFLHARFGKTLCDIYFTPYNRKIWQLDPSEMAIEWLDGKLPMPSIKEIFKANMLGMSGASEAAAMVHDKFFYPKEDGSQYIVEQLARETTIIVGKRIARIERREDGVLLVDNNYTARCVIYTGDIRHLPGMLENGIISDSLNKRLIGLQSHGTTNILYQCTPSRASWTYIPSPNNKAHRIINTGFFAESNTSSLIRKQGGSTSVLEFSGKLSREEALNEASSISGFQRFLGYNYREATYVVHEHGTREVVSEAKRILGNINILPVGRFAEWEYYNMDTAMKAALESAIAAHRISGTS